MASSFDLVSLTDLKRWLDIAGTDDDTLLSNLITQISRTILNLIDRPSLLPSTYTEVRDGGNELSIMLGQWPVIAVSSCTVNGVSLPPSGPLIAGAGTPCGFALEPSSTVPPGTMQRLSLRGFVFTSGIQNITISYSAGYQITNEKAVIPLTTPFTASAQVPYGHWASDGGVTYLNGLPLTAVAGNPSAGQYKVVEGTYNFSQADAGTAVLLTYGYVPVDLSSCCMDWAAERYAYRSRLGQHSKSLGGQETMSFIVKDIPDFVASALIPYRRVVAP